MQSWLLFVKKKEKKKDDSLFHLLPMYFPRKVHGKSVPFCKDKIKNFLNVWESLADTAKQHIQEFVAT